MTDQYGTPPGEGQPPYEQPGDGQPPHGQQPEYGQLPQWNSAPYGQGQYASPGGPGYGSPYQVPRSSNDAVIALVAAIASWVLCPVLPAIIALSYAGRAQRAIAASGGALTGQSMVTGARVIAWVHLALAAVLVVVFLVFLVAMTSGGI